MRPGHGACQVTWHIAVAVSSVSTAEGIQAHGQFACEPVTGFFCRPCPPRAARGAFDVRGQLLAQFTIMNLRCKTLLLCLMLISPALPLHLHAQQAAQGKPEDTEVWSPEPKVVTASAERLRPSDAIVLFDGSNHDEWVSAKDRLAGGVGCRRRHHDGQQARPATSRLNGDSTIISSTSVGVPVNPHRQVSSGVTAASLTSTGTGDDGYELQVLDWYNNKPMSTARPPASTSRQSPLPIRFQAGEWQVYDGSGPRHLQRRWLTQVASLRDGVPRRRAGAESLRVEGPDALHRSRRSYTKDSMKRPIKLQAHGDPSPPLSFRNIWLREL